MDVVEQLLTARIVAILRGDFGGRWVDYAGALRAGGLPVLEITLNSPGALDGIRALDAHYGGDICLGAGTVLSADEVHTAVDAGARFIIAPDTDEAVIAACRARGVPAIPGAFTATEVKRAYQLGAAIVKLFPAQSPDYVRAIHAPLGRIPLMATGGVSLENAAAFLRAGAAVLGIGSELAKPSLSPDQLAARAAQFAAAISGRQLA